MTISRSLRRRVGQLVFTIARGTPLEPRNVNTEWAKVCAAAGIAPIR